MTDRERPMDSQFGVFMRAGQAARFLGVSAPTLRRWRRLGYVTGHQPDPDSRTVWYKRDELEQVRLDSFGKAS